MADSIEIGSKRIEIVLADDHAMIRGGLRRVLDTEAGLNVVAEAGDVGTALRLTRAHQPQVVVVDLNMPGEPTLPAIPAFLEAAPGSAVVVLTMEADPAYARKALSAGARGYVLKEAAEAELVDAVRSVAAGRTYLDPGLGARLATRAPEPDARLVGLAHDDPRHAVGSTFAGHRIEGVVGRGGGGVVFRATDLILDRTVALKVIAPEIASNAVYRARFERESRVAAALDHPHVVEVFHAGEEHGLLYLTMRYVDGTDLRTVLRREEQLEPPRAVALLAQIASALDEAHALGLIHRDVKPENVLIASRSGHEHAFLTDFGISKRIAEESVTRTGVALGTVDYIAPEQAEGEEVDARADVYSLGCVLFQMLTGRVVFDRRSELEKLWAHVHAPPPAVRALDPNLPRGLDRVVNRALAKEPGARQQTAGELARDALHALEV